SGAAKAGDTQAALTSISVAGDEARGQAEGARPDLRAHYPPDPQPGGGGSAPSSGGEYEMVPPARYRDLVHGTEGRICADRGAEDGLRRSQSEGDGGQGREGRTRGRQDAGRANPRR